MTWCKDTARDAAVRAAEDNRTGPLPTLAEAIAAPFACTACGGFGMDHRCKESCEECDGLRRAMIPKSVSASSAVEQESKGVRMTKSDRQAADYRAEAIARPFAEAAKCSSPVSKTGQGQSGVRTERVTFFERITLEFSFDHRSNFRPKEWAATFLPGAVCQGISVRVVEETHFDDLAQVAMEREKLRGEIASVRNCWHVSRAANDVLKARVAELEAEKITQALTADRFAAAVMKADTLEARVAELEAAAKLAPHANDDGGSNHAAQAASGGNRPETPDGSSQAAKTELPTG